MLNKCLARVLWAASANESSSGSCVSLLRLHKKHRVASKSFLRRSLVMRTSTRTWPTVIQKLPCNTRCVDGMDIH
ncbi:hypothetical protein BCR44DRAFT_1044169 [Catenaria anguillulae PL171]|uniref:Uncharacterized protein n=1 Tax=Catenaria anguillulae PL171 TaxID=765915 RepID=A0A1Y2HRY2_9FUNG|nr:hypothetical protein BCR44DRAFT_1044169 [Catenaria anguillulae PL171]